MFTLCVYYHFYSQRDVEKTFRKIFWNLLLSSIFYLPVVGITALSLLAFVSLRVCCKMNYFYLQKNKKEKEVNHHVLLYDDFVLFLYKYNILYVYIYFFFILLFS